MATAIPDHIRPATTDRARAWAHEMRAEPERLRATTALARDSIEDGREVTPPAPDLLLHCWGFCAALVGHHRAEDDSLFPRIGEALPGLVPVIARLRQDHGMIGL